MTSKHFTTYGLLHNCIRIL